MFIPNERTDRTISAMEEHESRSLDEAFDQNSLGSTGQDRRKNGSLLSGLQNARPLRDLALPSIRPAGASSAGRHIGRECRRNGYPLEGVLQCVRSLRDLPCLPSAQPERAPLVGISVGIAVGTAIPWRGASMRAIASRPGPAFHPASRSELRWSVGMQGARFRGRTHWRRGRDSNPRYPCEYFCFRDRPIRPLWHLSERAANIAG